MSTAKYILAQHKKYKGKIHIATKMPLGNRHDLSIAYTPGVAEVSQAITKNKKLAYQYSNKGNLIAIITDGSAVLGLGNIGPEAAIPVMEGKAALLKEFAGVDAFPISLDSQDVEQIIRTIKIIAPNFAAINLEDISAPRCFEIERRLIDELDIPVFHDDQHGTAIVVLAALINASKLAGKKIKQLKIVISGAGAAGLSVAKLLYKYGVRDIIVLDSRGIVSHDRKDLHKYKKEVVHFNKRKIFGGPKEALFGADVFVGVSRAGILKKDLIKNMSDKPIVFALANPVPEIMPQDAKDAGAFIVATGRSDMDNQINNALVFPGLFKGLLVTGHSQVNDKIKIKIAEAIAGQLKNINRNKIIPNIFDKGLVDSIVKAIKKIKK